MEENYMLKNTKIYNGRSMDAYKNILQNQKTKMFAVNTKDLTLSCDADKQLQISFWNNTYPVRETALSSLLSRFKIGGDAFRLITDGQIQAILDQIMELLPDVVTVMITDGAISSVNSAIYSHLPMTEIVEKTEEFITPFYNNENRDIFIDSDYSTSQIYYFTDKTFTFNNRKSELVIKLTNSECGDASLSYGAYLKSPSNRYLIPIMNDISILHKGNSSFDTVDEKLSQLEGVITKNIEAVILLENILVKTPMLAVKDFGSQTGLPKKVIHKIETEISLSNNEFYYATELYEKFVKAVNEVVDKDERYQNDLLKLLRMDWLKYGEKITRISNTQPVSSTQNATQPQSINNQLSIWELL